MSPPVTPAAEVQQTSSAKDAATSDITGASVTSGSDAINSATDDHTATAITDGSDAINAATSDSTGTSVTSDSGAINSSITYNSTSSDVQQTPDRAFTDDGSLPGGDSVVGSQPVHGVLPMETDTESQNYELSVDTNSGDESTHTQADLHLQMSLSEASESKLCQSVSSQAADNATSQGQASADDVNGVGQQERTCSQEDAHGDDSGS